MNKFRIVLVALMLAFIITGCSNLSASEQAKSNTDTQPAPITPIKSLNLPTSIQFISISGDSYAGIWWIPKNQKSIASEVTTWLEQATSYTQEIHKSQNVSQHAGNIGPSQLHISTSEKHEIAVYPAYYVDVENGVISVHYIQDVLVFNNGGFQTYIESSQLYNWLKNNEWKTEFIQKIIVDLIFVNLS